jgi:hypothetical protein
MLVVGLAVSATLLMTALLMTTLLIPVAATSALLRPRLSRRLLALAAHIALLVSLALILISISHVLVVFCIAIGHERYSSIG